MCNERNICPICSVLSLTDIINQKKIEVKTKLALKYIEC